MTAMRRTLVVEPRPIGHRAFYLSLIVRALEDDVVTVLAPAGDPAILAHFKRRGLDPLAHDFIAPSGTGALAVIAQVAALCRERHFDRVFFAYLDEFLPDLLGRLSPFPCPVSGIWFHPYALDRRYRWLPPLDKRLRQRRFIHRALRHASAENHIQRLFFLDPAALPALALVNSSIPGALLPDPWEKTPTMNRAEARRHFGLPDDRIIFLHIGSSEKRKGLNDVITAFECLQPRVMSKRPLLLRVGENGRLNQTGRDRLAALEEKDMAMAVEGFVSEAEFIEYFAAADWVLLPYRAFRFSSGILSNAIAAGRPVIAANHGLIARTVRGRSLGRLFRHKSPLALADAIRQAMETDHLPAMENPAAFAPGEFIRRLRLDLCRR